MRYFNMKKTILCILLLILCCGCTAHDQYYAIDHFYIKEEGDAFKESVEKLIVDTFNWYRSIEGEDGVYIVHYEFYEKAMMREWKQSGIYQTVPESDLQYLVVSENYLKDSGHELSADEKELIRSGVRLYLLPESLSEEEAETMKAFLEEEALYGLEGGSLIDTAYMKDPRIEFRSYCYDEPLDTLSDGEVRDPIIYVASCENMKYFESESLIATGKKDGYIRLSEEAYRKYAKHLPQELKDKKVTFKGLSRISQ